MLSSTAFLFCASVIITCVAASWSYDERELEAPSRWGFVADPSGSRRFPTCTDGTHQSPINAVQAGVATKKFFAPLSWIESSNFSITNDGEDITLRINDVVSKLDDPSGSAYTLRYVQVHVPGAHTRGGGAVDGEIVFVHEADVPETSAYRYVVVATPLVASFGHHTALNTVIDATPTFLGTPVATSSTRQINLRAFLPSDLDAVVYEGSLMQPPCHEEALYYVLQDAITVSHLQLAALRSRRGTARATVGNTRMIQPQSGRAAARVKPAGRSVSLPSVQSVESVSGSAVVALVAIAMSGLTFIAACAALLIACCTERAGES